MNANNQIAVFNGEINHQTCLMCNARELHEFLQVGREFSTWIKDRIKKYGFLENQDFCSFDNFVKRETGGSVRIDYHITLDMAKELAMVENNAMGRQIRRYFIACEKQAVSQHISRLITVQSQKERLEVALLKSDKTAKKIVYYMGLGLTVSETARVMSLSRRWVSEKVRLLRQTDIIAPAVNALSTPKQATLWENEHEYHA
ncbi:MAG: antA/AntB antirepressor family protein [Neisseriaceae bacterium]|nr:antA/AntB antirepressor family protein [Neisseriaceae bacterium]MBQ9725411.1 antA/AntB antirepressor family protein [Neisseriaceae bacterium]MBR1818881.1 antA/AntB antirepressor family protein [Neisseriaceae bacterium]